MKKDVSAMVANKPTACLKAMFILAEVISFGVGQSEEFQLLLRLH